MSVLAAVRMRKPVKDGKTRAKFIAKRSSKRIGSGRVPLRYLSLDARSKERKGLLGAIFYSAHWFRFLQDTHLYHFAVASLCSGAYIECVHAL